MHPHLEHHRARWPTKRSGLWYRWTGPRHPAAVDASPLTGVGWPRRCVPLVAVSAWVLFALHQAFAWIMIALMQARFSPSGPGGGCPEPRGDTAPPYCGWFTELHVLHVVSLVGHGLFVLAHIAQTYLRYDALATDVPEVSSLAATVVLLVGVLFMESNERGLFFGASVGLPQAMVDVLRRFHGYFFSWAIVYTFWYHPMEGTQGHLAGFFYAMLILVQGSLPFTAVHVWPAWRLLLEVWVLIHGSVVAAVTQGEGIWRMFCFGFATLLVVTQMWGAPLDLPGWALALMGGLYAAALAAAYRKEPKMWHELTRIPTIEYAGVFLFAGVVSVPLYIAKAASGGTWPPADLFSREALGYGSVSAVAATVTVLSVLVVLCAAEVSEAIMRRKARAMIADGTFPFPLPSWASTSAGTHAIERAAEDDTQKPLLGPVEPSQGRRGGATGQERDVTVAELRRHGLGAGKDGGAAASSGRAWIAIAGVVYDVHDFANSGAHPGGRRVLERHCGTDATRAFQRQGHSDDARALLGSRTVARVGRLV